MTPLDPQMIPESAFAPSLVSQRHLENPERPVPDEGILRDNTNSSVIPNILEVDNATNTTDHRSKSDDELDDIPLNKLAKIVKDSAIARSSKYGEKTPVKNDESRKSLGGTTATDKTLTDNIMMDTSNEVLNRSFKELLPTPELSATKNKNNNTADRKKSLNYKAQAVTEDLFSSVSTKSTSVSATSRKL